MRIAKLIRTTVFVAMVVAAPRAPAETTPVEGAIEAWKVFVAQSETAPASLRVIPCRGCSHERFIVDDDFTLTIDGERISNDQLGRQTGEPGTVIYDLESGRAVRLIR